MAAIYILICGIKNCCRTLYMLYGVTRFANRNKYISRNYRDATYFSYFDDILLPLKKKRKNIIEIENWSRFFLLCKRLLSQKTQHNNSPSKIQPCVLCVLRQIPGHWTLVTWGPTIHVITSYNNMTILNLRELIICEWERKKKRPRQSATKNVKFKSRVQFFCFAISVPTKKQQFSAIVVSNLK